MFEITVDQLKVVKEAFVLRGESVADWARLRNFNAATVYSVLNGRIKCKRGEAHRIAIELGLKPSGQSPLLNKELGCAHPTSSREPSENKLIEESRM